MFITNCLLSSAKSGAIKVTKSVPLGSQLNKGPKTFKEKADEFIQSNVGKKLKLYLLTGTMISYPIGALIANGPLINQTFPLRYNVDYNIGDKLKTLVKEEYERFLGKENRIQKDANITYSVNKSSDMMDSIGKSSMSVRFGAHIALPFYTSFNNLEEASKYCKRNFKTMNYLGKTFSIDWDSESGHKLLEAMVLTDNAKRFVITRDMYANDGYEAYGNRSLSWATWTAFSSIFTFWVHQRSKLCNGSALSFAICYPLFLTCAWFSNTQWHDLYRYMQDIHADHESSHISFDHCAGGKEYYYKMLQRNRIIREFMPSGKELISAAGNIRSERTSFITRYDLLKDVSKEDDELKEVVSGDTW
uniref:Sterile domain-containing protein n=1 Tax=Rhabditophanes sp. KR3021 TaxID=114890 RepID=A0AC35U193_9BILA